MEYVLKVLKELQNEMDTRLKDVENQAGEENGILRAILAKLRVTG